MTARKHGVRVDGTALVCSSGSEERDGHGSTTRRAGARTTGRAVTVGGVATVGGVVTVDDVVPTTERAAVADDDDRAEPPQPARLTHPIIAMTALRRIRPESPSLGAGRETGRIFRFLDQAPGEVAPRGRSSSVSVGIDVAEPRKGLDLVALDPDRNVVAAARGLTLDEAVSTTLALHPAVVCIDSPSGWSRSGRSRLAERELARLGIQSYRTGPDPGDHPFYRWMRVGFEVFARLAPTYPRYRGGDAEGTAAEIFPHATACLLAGRLRPSGMAKHTMRRQVLSAAGIAEAELSTPDQVDAALGALTGLIALHQEHSAVGNPDEGVILLPVRTLPEPPLRARTAGHRPDTT